MTVSLKSIDSVSAFPRNEPEVKFSFQNRRENSDRWEATASCCYKITITWSFWYLRLCERFLRNLFTGHKTTCETWLSSQLNTAFNRVSSWREKYPKESTSIRRREVSMTRKGFSVHEIFVSVLVFLALEMKVKGKQRKNAFYSKDKRKQHFNLE